MSTLHRLLLVVGLLVAAGCTPKEKARHGEACVASADCAPSGFCVAGKCKDPRVDMTRVQLGLVGNALLMYLTHFRDAPKDIGALVEKRFLQPAKAKDPWGTEVRVHVPATPKGEYRICSAGPDARFETADDMCQTQK